MSPPYRFPARDLAADACDTCAFSRYQGTPLLSCRRRAPVADQNQCRAGINEATWPDVRPDDWCGEFEAYVDPAAEPPAPTPYLPGQA